MPVMKIESSLPNGCIFTAFSAYRMVYGDAPADYSEVYVYINKSLLEEIKKRFPEKKANPKLIILEADNFLKGKTAPISQLYSDLWSIKDWYARDFINALEKRLNLW